MQTYHGGPDALWKRVKFNKVDDKDDDDADNEVFQNIQTYHGSPEALWEGK